MPSVLRSFSHLAVLVFEALACVLRTPAQRKAALQMTLEDWIVGHEAPYLEAVFDPTTGIMTRLTEYAQLGRGGSGEDGQAIDLFFRFF